MRRRVWIGLLLPALLLLQALAPYAWAGESEAGVTGGEPTVLGGKPGGPGGPGHPGPPGDPVDPCEPG